MEGEFIHDVSHPFRLKIHPSEVRGSSTMWMMWQWYAMPPTNREIIGHFYHSIKLGVVLGFIL